MPVDFSIAWKTGTRILNEAIFRRCHTFWHAHAYMDAFENCRPYLSISLVSERWVPSIKRFDEENEPERIFRPRLPSEWR